MPTNVNYRANIWALKEEGCTHVIVTTACGSLKEDIHPGDCVILDQFIDKTTKRVSTFYDGEPKSPKGVCHIPMDKPFCGRTREIIIKTAKDLGEFKTVHSQGTAITIEGPRFSSKAESLLWRQWGGDVVNMTTVPEVCLAKEAGLCYAAVALPTDYDSWRSDKESVSFLLPYQCRIAVIGFSCLTLSYCHSNRVSSIPLFKGRLDGRRGDCKCPMHTCLTCIIPTQVTMATI